MLYDICHAGFSSHPSVVHVTEIHAIWTRATSHRRKPILWCQDQGSRGTRAPEGPGLSGEGGSRTVQRGFLFSFGCNNWSSNDLNKKAVSGIAPGKLPTLFFLVPLPVASVEAAGPWCSHTNHLLRPSNQACCWAFEGTQQVLPHLGLFLLRNKIQDSGAKPPPL